MHNVKYCDDGGLSFSLWMCPALVIIIPGIRMDWVWDWGTLSRKLGVDLHNCGKWIIIVKQKHYFYLYRYQDKSVEKKIFLNSDTFYAVSLFVDPARDCLMEEKLTTHFNFVESSSYKWIWTFPRIPLGLYCSEQGNNIYLHDRQWYFLQLSCSRNSVEMIEV